MSTAPPSDLAPLRAEIDRIDEAIVDLLGQRLRIVGEIAQVKKRSTAADGGAGLALRPAREALMLRRLAGLADGRFPKLALIRMWRELLAATTQAQGAFVVVVHVPPDRPEVWDLARDHFGSLTPMRRAATPDQVVRELATGVSEVAVMPLPSGDGPWWPALIDGSPTSPRVVAKLPFAARPDLAEGVGALALAVGLPQEATGDDATLLVLETERGFGRGRLRELLAIFSPRWLASHDDSAAEVGRHLVELAGFALPGDQRLAEALAPAGERVLRAVPLGCYARPLSASELA